MKLWVEGTGLGLTHADLNAPKKGGRGNGEGGKGSHAWKVARTRKDGVDYWFENESLTYSMGSGVLLSSNFETKRKGGKPPTKGGKRWNQLAPNVTQTPATHQGGKFKKSENNNT